MPSEVSIAKELSGPESLEACIHALRTDLAKDDRFMSHVAYRGFHAVIDFKFRPSMSFVPDCEREVVVVVGDQTDLEDEPTVDVKIEIPQRPPNQVREEADMPQPVLVTDGQGQSHEEWKKTSKTIPKNPVPKHNKVKGAA
jgi:hypothetical protein